MKKFLLGAIYFIGVCSLSAQNIHSFDLCNKTFTGFHENINKEEYFFKYDSFIHYYVNKNYHNLYQFVEKNTDSLLLFQNVICTPNVLEFGLRTKDIHYDCKILLDSVSLHDRDKVFLDVGAGESLLISVFQKNYYGNIQREDTSANKIHGIILMSPTDTIVIKEELFSDLFNPNLCNRYISILPLSLYYHPAKKVFYINIYGDISCIKPDRNDMYQQSYHSFFCKIIVYENGSKPADRIMIPTDILRRYGWMKCINFWPF